MENCYYWMLFSIIFFLIPRQTTSMPVNNIHSGIHGTFESIELNKLGATFVEKTYASGVIFDKLGDVRLISHTIHKTVNFGTEFVNRKLYFHELKIRTDLHCANFSTEPKCEKMSEILFNCTLHLEQALNIITNSETIYDINAIVYTLPHQIINASNLLVGNLTTNSELSKILYETMNQFQPQIMDVMNYLRFYRNVEQIMSAGKLPVDISLELIKKYKQLLQLQGEKAPEYYDVSRRAILEICTTSLEYLNGDILLHISIPVLHRRKYTLFQSTNFPVLMNNRLVTLKTAKYFLYNARDSKYFWFPSEQIYLCNAQINGTRACNFTNSLMEGYEYSCETKLLENEELTWKTCLFSDTDATNHIVRHFEVILFIAL